MTSNSNKIPILKSACVLQVSTKKKKKKKKKKKVHNLYVSKLMALFLSGMRTV